MSPPVTGALAGRLRSAGQRATPQRVIVADALEKLGRQATAAELWTRLRHRHPSIGRATVFRALEALVDAGLARRLESPGHVYTYVACQSRHHHHLACAECGQVIEVDESFIRGVANRARTELGFEIDDARLDFYGSCAACRAAA